MLHERSGKIGDVYAKVKRCNNKFLHLTVDFWGRALRNCFFDWGVGCALYEGRGDVSPLGSIKKMVSRLLCIESFLR